MPVVPFGIIFNFRLTCGGITSLTVFSHCPLRESNNRTGESPLCGKNISCIQVWNNSLDNFPEVDALFVGINKFSITHGPNVPPFPFKTINKDNSNFPSVDTVGYIV